MAYDTSYVGQVTITRKVFSQLDKYLEKNPQLAVAKTRLNNESWDVKDDKAEKSMQASFFKCSGMDVQSIRPSCLGLAVAPTHPKTTEEWLSCFQKPVSRTNPPLTLLLDIDKTVMISGMEPVGRFKNKIELDLLFYDCHWQTDTFYYDRKAILAATQGQVKGHNVVILTWGTYELKELLPLFKLHLLTVDKRSFYNNESMFGYDTKKGFIECHREEFDKSCLLIDDDESNQASNIHFLHCTDHSFPLY
ncbi:hypothetical protein D5018_14890 [Parashewanella curva]|uniref:Uncharacterized protein n=1 Tax=Parashewanella curva TaxID=2338552 RepID=A0A3L8PWR7_9GAMM|nr:hypothetical protein [Parashewanella curva]RLV58888.1 hypothetical protein D5018_14890 [Parashewanella curva]